jgi:hypothetical protein
MCQPAPNRSRRTSVGADLCAKGKVRRLTCGDYGSRLNVLPNFGSLPSLPWCGKFKQIRVISDHFRPSPKNDKLQIAAFKAQFGQVLGGVHGQSWGELVFRADGSLRVLWANLSRLVVPEKYCNWPGVMAWSDLQALIVWRKKNQLN